jgi:hypothetical protein
MHFYRLLRWRYESVSKAKRARKYNEDVAVEPQGIYERTVNIRNIFNVIYCSLYEIASKTLYAETLLYVRTRRFRRTSPTKLFQTAGGIIIL